MAVQPIDWNAGGNVSLQEMLLADKWRGERQARNRMQPDIQPALQGDTGALARVFQASPDTGARIAQFIGMMDANKRRALAEYTDFITRDGMGILQAPAAARPQLYAQTLELARQRGYDVSTMPPQYGADAEAKLKFYVQRALPFATALKRMGAGGGGAPAPAAGGWTNPGAAPRVSAAPMPAGPAVADASQPPASPTMPADGRPTSPMPQVADAGPMPQGAPQAPVQPFSAPPGPMLAQTPTVAPAAPQAAPAPVQVAGGAGVPDDSGDNDGPFVPASRVNDGRLINLPPGAEVKVSPRDGKPIETAGKIYLRMPPQPGQAQGALVMFDPAARKVYAAHPAGDRIVFVDPENPSIQVGEIKMGRLPAERTIPPGYEPDPANPSALRPIIGGPADPETIKKQTGARERAAAKALPPSTEKAMTENVKAILQVDRALALLDKTPDSVGGPGSVTASIVPGVGNLQNRWGDPAGTDLRAVIANIGSLIIHERSGAAVTAAEFPRLRPFIPSIADDPATVRKKLEQFRLVYLDEMRATHEYYAPENGFKAHSPTERYLRARGGGSEPQQPGGTVTVPMPGGGSPAPSGGGVPADRARELRSKYGLD